jgi:hypothetical protein
MKYRFTVYDKQFGSARSALAYVVSTRSFVQPCLIRVNGEAISLAELRIEAAHERAELEHNRKQGL